MSNISAFYIFSSSLRKLFQQRDPVALWWELRASVCSPWGKHGLNWSNRSSAASSLQPPQRELSRSSWQLCKRPVLFIAPVSPNCQRPALKTQMCSPSTGTVRRSCVRTAKVWHENTGEGSTCTRCGIRTALCVTLGGDRCHCVTADPWCPVRQRRPSGLFHCWAHNSPDGICHTCWNTSSVCLCVCCACLCGQICVVLSVSASRLAVTRTGKEAFWSNRLPFQRQTWLAARPSKFLLWSFPHTLKDKHSGCSHGWPWCSTPATVGLLHKQWVKDREPGG